VSLGDLALDDGDRALLTGQGGPGRQLAMRVVVAMGAASGADRLVPIVGAHVDGCLYHGPASLDFARRLRAGGARTVVPTTSNVGGFPLSHPMLWRGDPGEGAAAAELMRLYAELGCRPTFTCAPYQLRSRPATGDVLAWAESNAIVFANSVLGARTNRNGDFLDISAAVVGKAPRYGLLTEEGRWGGVIVDVSALPAELLASDVLAPVLGHVVGQTAGDRIPVIVGLPPHTTEDALKAFGAAAASSGSVAMFHAVGVTPEAADLATALGGRDPSEVQRVEVTLAMVAAARDELTTAAGARLAAVSLGTPHFSLQEFRALATVVAREELAFHPAVDVYVSTSRAVLEEARSAGLLAVLDAPNVHLLTDTCTYVAPVMWQVDGPVMTNSAKWAFYAPSNLGLDVVFGSLTECLRSAAAGTVQRDPALWRAC
jgi:predicted aconitase